ncbi:MAG: competence protein ComEC [Roseibaca calidilacus]|uniref:Competence protein ComEC n=1 Tax=Roseibaca calidilacus TaxID=1666912 RepID=A0A0P7WVQ3_9RHOB|nr:ComEC/Rec2 family competence protein [Roseibaca calidilacus]KPP91768.1 MAG: competence protein ComEC [Roseibaca calidilacus]CUX82548.1 competence protein ComEC [Roseibaca calidilacus]
MDDTRARLGDGPVAQALAAQRGRLFLFVPVCLGIGIGVYFGLPVEPTQAQWVWLAGAMACLGAIAVALPVQVRPLAIACLLVGAGGALAGWRTHSVAAPVLDYRYYGPIEGRIVKVDRAASGALRLTLDRPRLAQLSPARTPALVRISLHGEQGFVTPRPGLRVMTTGHLSPPPGPSEPGGFDFRRHAWYERLGAVGYTRVPVLELAQEGGKPLGAVRARLSQAIQDRMPGAAGGFAAAILTGDRSGVDVAHLEDLRNSNLAHLLAISGLHMGLLTGFVFAALRFVLALWPAFALRVPTRKLAALGGLAAGGLYLALSGGNVATQRAYIMVAVMFVAVLLDRRAISLRSVAMAAVIVLVLRPEALVQAGFQMSFAATVALVAIFRALNDDGTWRGRVPRWAMPVVSVVLCSVVAGVATAPIAAASFNRLVEYGLLANLAAVPLMGLVIMPAGVLAAVLAPFGLEGLALAVMTPAIDWILLVARFVAGLDGAVTGVVQPPGWVIPTMALGALWLIIWAAPARWLGVPVMACAVLGWAVADRPALLIADNGAVVGLMGPEGRVLSRARSGAFAAGSWLQGDGDLASQEQAQTRGSHGPSDAIVLLKGRGVDVVHLSGKRALEGAEALCLPGRIFVTNTDPDTPIAGPCQVLTPRALRASGAVAIWRGTQGPIWRTVREDAGARPWTAR